MKTNGEREEWDTPCRGVCSTTNVGDSICRGCGRTAEEVINWNSYTRDQKVAVNRRLKIQKSIWPIKENPDWPKIEPEYLEQLQAVPNEERRKFLEGDWNGPDNQLGGDVHSTE